LSSVDTQPADAEVIEDGLADRRRSLLEFLTEHCVIRSAQEVIISTTGEPISWMVDTRIALLNPEMAEIIAELYWTVLSGIGQFQIACMELTGVPLMVSVQSYGRRIGRDINGFIIRKEQKNTGRQRRVEGIINSLPIVFVDDIMNSGSSLKKALVFLQSIGRSISTVVALIDFGPTSLKKSMAEHGVGIHALIDLKELGVDKTSNAVATASLPLLFGEVWNTQLEGSGNHFYVFPKSTPAIDDEFLFIGTDAGVLSAIVQRTGEIKWKYSLHKNVLKGIWASPCICNDFVCCGGYDGNFYAIEKRSGELVWRYDSADWIGSSACFAPNLGLIFVGVEYALTGHQGGIIALDYLTGRQRWEVTVADLIHCSPIYVNSHGCVAVGSNSGDFLCLDGVSGKLLWTFRAKGEIKAAASIDTQKKLFIFGTLEGYVYALNMMKGELSWRTKLDGPVYSQPLIDGLFVYVTCLDKRFYILRAKDGHIIDRFEADGKLFSAPAKVGERIYFGSTGGTVLEYSPDMGSITGADYFPGKITGKVIFSNENQLFFVTTLDNQVFGLRSLH
jgi:outer membrane protein assembly factor BamB